MLAWCRSCRRENQCCLLLKTSPSGYVYSRGEMHACTRIHCTFTIHGMHTHAYTYTAHTCIHIHCTHMHTHTLYTHTHMRAHIHTLTHTHMCMHTHTYMHTHLHACSHAHTFSQTHTHMRHRSYIPHDFIHAWVAARMRTHSLTHTCAIDHTFPMISCMLGWLFACAYILSHTHMHHRSYIPHDFMHV